MSTKICRKCGIELPASEYQKHNGFKDGYYHTCRRCSSKMETPDTIVCESCMEELSYIQFGPSGRTITGRSIYCQSCVNSYNRKELSKRRIHNNVSYRECKNRHNIESRKKNFIHATWKACQIRAKIKGLEFNIEESDIIIPEICPILEHPLILGSKNDYEYTPSIDRIDNSKGYIKGNIQIISKKANSMKNSATFEELTTFCKNILRYSPTNTKDKGIELEDKEPLR